MEQERHCPAHRPVTLTAQAQPGWTHTIGSEPAKGATKDLWCRNLRCAASRALDRWCSRLQNTGKHRAVLNFGKEKPPEPGRSPEFQRFLGGAEGTRTPDPLHAMQVRYQLRHSPKLLVSIDPSAVVHAAGSNLISLMEIVL